MWRWDSDPFGASAPNEDPNGWSVTFSLPLRFAGQYFDAETGTHYNYFRDYDPGIGRYVQSDPVGLAGGSLSPYVYANNNPLTYIDPDGLRVTVYSRLIEDWRAKAIRARHAWINLEPDDLSQVQCLLRQSGLSNLQFPLRIGGYMGPSGALIVAANAPSDSLDQPDPNRLSRVLGAPGQGLSCGACGAVSADSKFILDLLVNAGGYRNNLPYNPVPASGDGYNSNSFAQGRRDPRF